MQGHEAVVTPGVMQPRPELWVWPDSEDPACQAQETEWESNMWPQWRRWMLRSGCCVEKAGGRGGHHRGNSGRYYGQLLKSNWEGGIGCATAFQISGCKRLTQATCENVDSDSEGGEQPLNVWVFIFYLFFILIKTVPQHLLLSGNNIRVSRTICIQVLELHL